MEASNLVSVHVHRCCLSKILLYSVIFSSMLAWIFGTGSHHHDGRTVTLMLAKLGEGPLGKRNESYNAKINCGHQDSCGDHLFIADEADSIKNLCWGYEKDCRKENRLFLPQCQSPPKPWYALIHKSKLKSHCMSNIALLQNLAPFHSMRLSCNNI